MTLDRKTLSNVLADPYNAPVFPNRTIDGAGFATWRVGGLGLVDEAQLIELLLAAREPTKKSSWWEFWKSSVGVDEIEDIARHHIWQIRMQATVMAINRHAIMQYRFKSIALLDKFLKETNHD